VPQNTVPYQKYTSTDCFFGDFATGMDVFIFLII